MRPALGSPNSGVIRAPKHFCRGVSCVSELSGAHVWGEAQ